MAMESPQKDLLINVSHILRQLVLAKYHKWSLTICDGCFDTLKSSKSKVRQVTKDVVKSEV